MPFPRRLTIPIVLALTAALAACSPAERRAVVVTPPPAPAPGPEPPADLERRLAEAIDDFDAGAELLAAGDGLAGEEVTGDAARRVRELAQACAAAPDCDFGRLLDTYDRLLDLQGLRIKEQALRVLALEAGLVEEEAAVETAPPGDEAVEEEGESSFVETEAPEIERTVRLLRGTDLAELITLNDPIRAALDDWLTWMRPNLMEAWENYQFLRDRMAPVYEEAELPEALLFAMIATESGGKVHAVSRAGAAGPLQFIRSTGRRFGLVERDGFDLRYDPEAATRANVAYLNEQFAALNNSLEKALAAYNGGEARMRGLERRHRGRSFWDSDLYYGLPSETRDYVPRVLAAAWLFLHADDYNLEWPEVDRASAPVTLRAPASIGELAICLGQAAGARDGWFRTLRNLNPRLGPGERVEAGSTIVMPVAVAATYEARCLDGPVVARASELREASHPERPPMIPYVVRRGDTLSRIAARHPCASLREIAAINGLRPPRYTISVGQRLRIPRCP